MELNNKKKRFAVILGARPNFVKAAPFLREAKNHPNYNFTLIHTGQHFDDNMSKIFFDEMSIPRPDIHLNIKGEFYTEKIGKMFSVLKKIFSTKNFDGVVVFGDINSTLAGAVAAAKNTKIIHIESGLRSYDRRMPEEINRVIVDHLSDLLFVTEPSGKNNLIKEEISRTKIKYVGNIMIESIEVFLNLIQKSEIIKILNLKRKSYIVATFHRLENTDNPVILLKLLKLLRSVSKKNKVVFPLHPGTKEKIMSYKFSHLLKGLNIMEPLGYLDFMKLVIESKGVITDSGGLQEETSHLGIPCATLRDNTERPITVDIGSNKLFPIHSFKIRDIFKHLDRKDFKSRHIPMWDSFVSKRIFVHLDKL